MIPTRTRSHSAPPTFPSSQTLMGYIDSAPLITAETYNLPLSPSRSRSRPRSRRTSLAPSLPSIYTVASSCPSYADVDVHSPLPLPPYACPSLSPGEQSCSLRGSVAGTLVSPVSVSFSTTSGGSSGSEGSGGSDETAVSDCLTCRTLASHESASASASTFSLRQLKARFAPPHSSGAHLAPAQAKPAPVVYMDQAHWTFFFGRAAHEPGCGCRACVKAEPTRAVAQGLQQARMRAYERRPSAWGRWGKGVRVVWSQWARERRGMVEGEGGMGGRVKVSRVYEVEW